MDLPVPRSLRPARTLSTPLIGLTLALALLVSLAVSSYRTAEHQAASADWVAHTYDVVSKLHRLYATVQAAESAQRGFSSSGREEFAVLHHASEEKVPAQLSTLRQLVANNVDELHQLVLLSAAIDARLELTRTRIEERRRLGAAVLAANLQSGAGLRLMEKVNAAVEKMIHSENTLLAERRRTMDQARVRSRNLLIAGWSLSILLLAAVFTALVRQMIRAGRAEEATLKSNQQLQEANNELRAFSYSVAHDLRAPLRAINGFSRVAIEEAGQGINEEARAALTRIAANANMMAQLIDDLLALSRISYQPLKSVRVEMSALAREVYDQLIEGERGREVELEMGELPPAVGDPMLLRQVWQNLIGNALKFTRRRAKTRIEIGGASGGLDFVTYYVRDNGAGFDMQYGNKLFGAFQRLHRPTDFEGTGIGLALVHRIVTRHGGTVWAEGKEDEGARFAFTLPVGGKR